MDTKMKIATATFAAVVMTVCAQDTAPDHTAENTEVAHVATSSRLILGTRKSEWMEGMRERLCIAKRATGPFGLAQDPNVKIAKPREEKVKKGAFLEAVAAIKINTVMPMDDKFTSRSREFTIGEIFPVIKNRRQFNVEIMEIKSTGIVFKDIDTGEQVRKNLDTLPVGMKKSTHLDAIPGVFPANKKNAMPLVLDDESQRAIRQ
jgi:hypothetical protein